MYKLTVYISQVFKEINNWLKGETRKIQRPVFSWRAFTNEWKSQVRLLLVFGVFLNISDQFLKCWNKEKLKHIYNIACQEIDKFTLIFTTWLLCRGRTTSKWKIAGLIPAFSVRSTVLHGAQSEMCYCEICYFLYGFIYYIFLHFTRKEWCVKL